MPDGDAIADTREFVQREYCEADEY